MWLKKKLNKNRLCGKKISADRKEIKQYLQIWWRLRSINWCGSVQLYGPNWVSAGRWTERIFQRKSSVIKITQYKQWDGQNKRTVLAVKKKKHIVWTSFSSFHELTVACTTCHHDLLVNVGDKNIQCVWNEIPLKCLLIAEKNIFQNISYLTAFVLWSKMM